MTKSSLKDVKSRLVLNFPGFEKTEPFQQLDRMEGNGQSFAEVWKLKFDLNDRENQPDDHLAVANFSAEGKNWKTNTRLIQFDWHDIIAQYEGQPYPQSFFANFPKYLSFYLDGTVIRYFMTHWRYGVFTIYPILAMIIFAVASYFVAQFLVETIVGPNSWLVWLLTLIFVMILNKWPGDKLYMNLSINDWGFARDLAKQTNPSIEQRFDAFAERLAKELQQSDHDEIVIVGHSFGTIWATQALARMTDKHPQLLEKVPVTFLSLGSSLLKINLIPQAKDMRAKTKTLLSQPSLLWDETQTHIDLIAFFGTKPETNLDLDKVEAEVHISEVRYSRVMDKKRYRKMRKSFYRSHRQYIMYQDVRCHFDYFLKCFGPIPIRDLARDPECMKRIDNEGQLHDHPVN